jgi:hypothetical protein
LFSLLCPRKTVKDQGNTSGFLQKVTPVRQFSVVFYLEAGPMATFFPLLLAMRHETGYIIPQPMLTDCQYLWAT